MKSRYLKGEGRAPFHLVEIQREYLGRGKLIFSDDAGGNRHIAFESEEQLLSFLRTLQLQRVAFAVGGQLPGSAEEIAMLIARGSLQDGYIELAWSAPQRWTIREISQDVLEWEQVADIEQIIDTSLQFHDLEKVLGCYE